MKPDAAAQSRRRRIAMLLLILGIGLSAYGFYDLSIWNEAPSHWWGASLFTIGAVLLVAGVFCFLGSLSDLFDMRNRKGGI